MLVTELQAPEITIELPGENLGEMFDQIQSNNRRLRELDQKRLDRFAEIIKTANRGANDMRQDVVSAGIYDQYHYVICRMEPRWFRVELFDPKGKWLGTTFGSTTVKGAWKDAIRDIVAIRSK